MDEFFVRNYFFFIHYTLLLRLMKIKIASVAHFSYSTIQRDVAIAQNVICNTFLCKTNHVCIWVKNINYKRSKIQSNKQMTYFAIKQYLLKYEIW